MDPEETLKQLRNAMIEISDLLSTRLANGRSGLRPRELEMVVEEGAKVVEHGEALMEWLANGGYMPKGHR